MAALLPSFSTVLNLLGWIVGLNLLAFVVYVLQNEIVRWQSRVKNLPGPQGWPIVGNLWQLRGQVHAEQFRVWSQKYGDVFQVQLGNTTVVVINSVKSAKSLFLGKLKPYLLYDSD